MTELAAKLNIAESSTSGDMRHVVARLERLPYCSWHLKMRLIICTAWFFDAFDSIAIAVVLPPLIGMWHLNPEHIGPLIGIGFLGQLVGAIAFGWIAEHWGRRGSLLATLLIFSIGSLACAAATTYNMLFWLRFVQGIGLGGEIPLMAAYVNEFAHAKDRGRFSISIQVLFSVGLLAVALVGVYVVPRWGWQWMFIIGAIPALIAIPLRAVLPESPRWLASQGRYEEADRALTRIEQTAMREGRLVPPLPADLPAVPQKRPRFADLFKGIYLRRTISVWLLWIGAYFVSYGITAWMPSLFRTVYHLSVQDSLVYGLINNAAGLCGAFLALYLSRPSADVGCLSSASAAVVCFFFPLHSCHGSEPPIRSPLRPADSSFSVPRCCRSRLIRRKFIRRICAHSAAALRAPGNAALRWSAPQLSAGCCRFMASTPSL